MRYAFLVAWREYAENARTKGFWISLFLMPTILFLSAQVPIWLHEKATPTRCFVVVDQSQTLGPVVQANMERDYQQKVLAALNDYAHKWANPPAPGANAATDPWAEFGDANPQAVKAFMNKGGQSYYLKQLEPRLKAGAPPFKEPRQFFQAVHLPPDIRTDQDLNAITEQLKPYLRGEKTISVNGRDVGLDAAVLIPRDIDQRVVRPGKNPVKSPNTAPAPDPESAAAARGQIQYWSVNASDFTLRDDIERMINQEIRRKEYLARGLDSQAIHEVEQTYAPFASLNPKKEKGQEAINTVDVVKQWAPSGFVYLLWLAIFVVVQMLLNNTIEEKSNRIIEVLLSSVTPGELMMGKLFGIAAVGLTMVGAWMLALFGVVSWKAGGPSELGTQLLVVLKGSNLIPLFSVYFLLGYLMYAAFILSIGSVCNTIKEAQSYMGVMTVIMMVPLLTMTFIPKDPNGALARLLSWIPLYTPFTMMNRANADPPLVDLFGTLALLLATTFLALWMAGKIFRIGILRTGQPPKVIEMLRWALRR